MYREVYRYLFSTYGKTVGYWIGFVTGVIQFFIIRVYVVIIMANVASAIATGNLLLAKQQTAYYLIAYVFGSIIGAAGDIYAVRIENQEYGILSVEFYKKLINKDMLFYQDHQTGYLATAFRQYLDSSLQLVRFWRSEALGAIVSLVIPAVVLLLADRQIGLIAIVVVIVQLVYIVWASAKAQPYRKTTHEIYRKITAEVSDEITNIVAFKSSGIGVQAEKIIANLSKQETAAYYARRKLNILLDLPRGIITASGIALAVYRIILHTTSHDAQSLSLIVLTLTYMFQIIRNVAVLPDLIGTHDDYVSKIYPSLAYLTDMYETITDPVQPQPLEVRHGAITITTMSFSYPSHDNTHQLIPVFNNLNIVIKPGEQVGIVGLSGAGKSTLANLLLRFNDVTSGSIMIDGIDIRNVRQQELRRTIAYVPQEPLLFHRTIRENIAYFDDTISEQQVIQAAKAAHAHDFIMELPKGYDTVVGERGVKLSGGQKQRVAIARAIVKQAPIIVFDEATSALDSESEEIIQQALPEILGKQTAIIIAHRLSTIAGLDRIIVMDKGQIIEQGTHQALLRQQGRYYRLWQKQTKQK